MKSSQGPSGRKGSDLAVVSCAIYNPWNLRHFMRLKPARSRIRVWKDGMLLAETSDALCLLEVGHDVYDPVLCTTRADTKAIFVDSQTETHCPLKGGARYLDLIGSGGQLDAPDIAWTYPEPFDFAAEIGGRIAFDSTQVTVEESPL